MKKTQCNKYNLIDFIFKFFFTKIKGAREYSFWWESYSISINSKKKRENSHYPSFPKDLFSLASSGASFQILALLLFNISRTKRGKKFPCFDLRLTLKNLLSYSTNNIK